MHESLKLQVSNEAHKYKLHTLILLSWWNVYTLYANEKEVYRREKEIQ